MLKQQNCYVMVVNDNPMVRASIATCLLTTGFFVVEAFDGLDAIAKLRVRLPDVIICGLSISGMSESEFVAVLRTRFPQILVVCTHEDAALFPPGFDADTSIYKSGLGFEQLIPTLTALTGKPPIKNVQPRRINNLVEARRGGDGNYRLDCQECMREMFFPHTSNGGRKENWTICVHCGALIHFLAANDDPQATASSEV